MTTEVLRDSFSPEEAATLLERDRVSRIEQCAKEVMLVCERFDCSLLPEVKIVGSEIVSTLRVVSKV